MFRTITARYAGQCKRCQKSFEAGERIRFGGYGRTYHLSAQCPAAAAAQLTASDEPGEPEDEPQQPVTQPQPLPVLEADIITDEPADEPSGYYKDVHWSDPAADVDSAF